MNKLKKLQYIHYSTHAHSLGSFNIFNRGEDNPADASPPSPLVRLSSWASQYTIPPEVYSFVYCDEKGRLQMDPEAVATLQLVKEPIGVVCVCGRARQGKSYILNQLLGRSSGFQVASTYRPCTKGLWLWNTPLVMEYMYNFFKSNGHCFGNHYQVFFLIRHSY
ncbi:unnamed protein product [Lathyrus sativus]|nr:unnamed protein product [Lathyrus sativus]